MRVKRNGWAEINFRRYERKKKWSKVKRPHDASSRRSLLKIYAGNAFRRGVDFNLSLEQFTRLTQRNCEYCGVEPKQEYSAGGVTLPCIYNGIDRVDNSRGYSIDNCVPCCKICNRMKSVLSATEFLEHISKIYRHGAAQSEEHIDSRKLILSNGQLLD